MEIEVDISGVLTGLDIKGQEIGLGIEKGILKSSIYLEAQMVKKINSNIPPPLKEETIKWKLSHPGHGGSLALVATAEMFDQLTHQVSGLEAKVGVFGSRAEVAVIHEFGAPSAGIPERSFIRSTFNEEKANIEDMVIEEIKKVITP